jgi:hypothetical protein
VDGLKRELWERLLQIPGMEEGDYSWGEALSVNTRQIANFHQDGMEVRPSRPLIREIKDRLKADARVTLRPNSDWVGFALHGPDDIEIIAEMATAAAPLYLPADCSAPKPPPTGRHGPQALAPGMAVVRLLQTHTSRVQSHCSRLYLNP